MRTHSGMVNPLPSWANRRDRGNASQLDPGKGCPRRFPPGRIELITAPGEFLLDIENGPPPHSPGRSGRATRQKSGFRLIAPARFAALSTYARF